MAGWFLNQYKVPNNENIKELSLVWRFEKFGAKMAKMSQKLCPGTNHDAHITGYSQGDLGGFSCTPFRLHRDRNG